MEKTVEGWGYGILGVIVFSGSMPATRAALAGFDPLFITGMRAALAGIAALILLLLFRQPRPSLADFLSLAIVAGGAVLGFPLLSSMALRHINAAQSQIFIGMLPLATATFGVIRAGERPRFWFWLFAGLGSACVTLVALYHHMGLSRVGVMLMLAAVIVCGLGYAEGGKLARKLGGWQVICWALVLVLPFTLLLSGLNWPATMAPAPFSAWVGLIYVSFFSMLIGFMFWYRGLALAGITTVGQLQLLQPGLGLIASALLLNEAVPPALVLIILALMFCVVGAKRFA